MKCAICYLLKTIYSPWQDEKNQMMTTNVWVKQVCFDQLEHIIEN